VTPTLPLDLANTVCASWRVAIVICSRRTRRALLLDRQGAITQGPRLAQCRKRTEKGMLLFSGLNGRGGAFPNRLEETFPQSSQSARTALASPPGLGLARSTARSNSPTSRSMSAFLHPPESSSRSLLTRKDTGRRSAPTPPRTGSPSQIVGESRVTSHDGGISPGHRPTETAEFPF
jgi:hypothetical protein